MERYLFCASAGLFLASAIWVWYTRVHMRRLMEHMNAMLEDAADGRFQESVYDESMLSSVETKLAHYLSASEAAAKNMSEEKVKQLIADISHQTKTPVANLLLYVQMLEEKELQPQEQSFVQEISRQAQKLNFLTASLVKASRLETGMIVLHPKWDFISPMLEEAASQVAAKAACKGQTMELALQDNF